MKNLDAVDNDIRIYAMGAAFDKGVYNLRTLELVIASYRSILDQLVAVQMGRRQLTAAVRNQIDYDVAINAGSLELLVNFVFTDKETIAGIASDGGEQLANGLVSLYRDAIDLRKAASSFIDQGLKFNVKIENRRTKNKGNVQIETDNQEIFINDTRILWAAQTTRSPTDRLVANIDGREVQYLDMHSRKDNFRLDLSHSNILGREREKLPTTLSIVGRLDVIAFSSHRGSIISNDERFAVTWEEDNRSLMQKMADVEGVIFRVEPVVDHKRLNSDAIGFHILDCYFPQTSG